MDELYDWAKEEEQRASRVFGPYDVSRLPMAPPPRLIVTQQPNSHGPDCWCSRCGGGPTYRQPTPVQGAPLLDKVVALVVAFAAIILGGMVLLPLLMPLMVIALLFVVAGVAALAILLGIVRAVTDRPVRETAAKVRAGRWR